MCGIAGYIGRQEISEGAIRECQDLMHRRGPDHQAYRHFAAPGGHVYLLHSRLSIIDLDERANQPLDKGSRSIIFNGELYNYVELREDLARRGETFATSSDTEVLLTAIGRDGLEVLDRCEGMWAFAVYDQGDHSLTLCRDRFGEKPLYLYRDASGLYFGSEAKFIAALLGRRLEVDRDHLCRYLVHGYKALYKGPTRFFRNLEELAPATFLRASVEGETTRRSYWTPRFEPDPEMSYDEAVQGARQRLIRAVEIRLRADVPLAFCMSGGVDSNALISIAKNVFDYDVHGFTIANADARYEEQEMVEHAVSELGIRHTSIPVDTRDFLARLKTLVTYHDAPVITITYFAHWLLMESIAKHGYRISISGTAADELFTGYYDHHLAYLYEVRNQPDLQRKSLAAWNEHIRPIVRNPFLSNPTLFIEDPNFRGHIFLDADGFARYLNQTWSEPFREEAYTASLLRNRMANEMFHENVPVILHEDDLNAMYFSIENRSPYLDRDLFGFCNRIPSQHLVQDGFAKAVLRDSMKGIAPRKVLESRRKVGFNAPIYSFLDVTRPEVRASLLEPSPIFDLVSRDKIERLIEKPDLPNSESKFLFYFLSSKMFLEVFE